MQELGFNIIYISNVESNSSILPYLGENGSRRVFLSVARAARELTGSCWKRTNSPYSMLPDSR